MASLVNTKGVDISSLNRNVDINKIKAAGYKFVMIRCCYGENITSQDDNQFETNVKKCEAAGMPWGAYIYSYALNTSEAKDEVEHVLRLLKGKKPTLPIAFDMEDADGYKKRCGMPSNSTLVNICKTFLSEIKKAGYYPSLYASLSWLNNQLNDSSLLNNYDIWVAQWSSKCDYKKSYGMWQYGGETNFIESSTIPGVGTIDKNYCYKDYPTIIKNGEYNNWKKTSTTTTTKPTTTTSTTTVKKPSLYLQGVANNKWLKVMKDGNDFSGVLGIPLSAFAIKVSAGVIKYSAHVKGGKWLDTVTGFNANDYNNGYAGSGSPAGKGAPIDAVKIEYITPQNIINTYGYYKVAYRVHVLKGKWLDWQYDTETSNGQDGYAGIYGKTIDGIEVKLVKA